MVNKQNQGSDFEGDDHRSLLTHLFNKEIFRDLGGFTT